MNIKRTIPATIIPFPTPQGKRFQIVHSISGRTISNCYGVGFKTIESARKFLLSDKTLYPSTPYFHPEVPLDGRLF